MAAVFLSKNKGMNPRIARGGFSGFFGKSLPVLAALSKKFTAREKEALVAKAHLLASFAEAGENAVDGNLQVTKAKKLLVAMAEELAKNGKKIEAAACLIECALLENDAKSAAERLMAAADKYCAWQLHERGAYYYAEASFYFLLAGSDAKPLAEGAMAKSREAFKMDEKPEMPHMGEETDSLAAEGKFGQAYAACAAETDLLLEKQGIVWNALDTLRGTVHVKKFAGGNVTRITMVRDKAPRQHVRVDDLGLRPFLALLHEEMRALAIRCREPHDVACALFGKAMALRREGDLADLGGQSRLALSYYLEAAVLFKRTAALLLALRNSQTPKSKAALAIAELGGMERKVQGELAFCGEEARKLMLGLSVRN